MRFHALAGAVALTLAACSTVSRDEPFSGTAGQSYVLIAIDGTSKQDDTGHVFRFYPVDLASTTFQGKFVPVWFSINPLLPGHELEKPETMAALVRFGGEKIAPGDYALVSHVVTKEGPAALNRADCYSLGAPVYRFRDGTINIVPRGNAAAQDLETLQAQVAEVLTRYPQMTAPRALAQQLGTASFETGRAWNGAQDCDPKGTFAFTAGKSAPPQ
ncbi:MAG TPA: hypothetical protein VE974_18595 [Thermoanaerobaculia bacterium]|nr:hypothetical protein [Thermoanaerobaculia bacterium]